MHRLMVRAGCMFHVNHRINGYARGNSMRTTFQLIIYRILNGPTRRMKSFGDSRAVDVASVNNLRVR